MPAEGFPRKSGRQQAEVQHGPPGAGFLPPLALLLKTAQHEIDWHVNDHGLCAVCGSAFPCERARLADLALSGL